VIVVVVIVVVVIVVIVVVVDAISMRYFLSSVVKNPGYIYDLFR